MPAQGRAGGAESTACPQTGVLVGWTAVALGAVCTLFQAVPSPLLRRQPCASSLVAQAGARALHQPFLGRPGLAGAHLHWLLFLWKGKGHLLLLSHSLRAPVIVQPVTAPEGTEKP